ncbi:preprotein translocase subunit SecE [Mycolicibacterium aichiense]|uniref:Protein translocase subunit SecE n=1 Tax=Mycolicibacterium aichiense TaxID=1799 RepID=A0AAD1MF49_9MYCO|nr:preprotein translocase subunit SecE [Mycolicibacterium aichiense]MCV7016367.1 preprotein translocase subunit SecE [Mycolicibacterium aichiense]BBX09859.1 protein translocase subunit SecE [Mycolicibacterium aichiense]STZ26473.1 preprotein translocase subunit SecE [Mycolicibacterium aichiense]
MSDERESADAAGAGDGRLDGDEDTTGGQTVVVTRPARPTGKRSRRAGATALAEPEEVESTAEELGVEDKPGKKTKAKKKKVKSGPSHNPILFVWNYLKQVVAELRKVIWPNRKQMVSYTTVVLLFLAFMVALIGGVDLGLAKLVLWVFG